jgi:hypothetical protein
VASQLVASRVVLSSIELDMYVKFHEYRFRNSSNANASIIFESAVFINNNKSIVRVLSWIPNGADVFLGAPLRIQCFFEAKAYVT